MDNFLTFHKFAIFYTYLTILVEKFKILHITKKQTTRIGKFCPYLLSLRAA